METKVLPACLKTVGKTHLEVCNKRGTSHYLLWGLSGTFPVFPFSYIVFVWVASWMSRVIRSDTQPVNAAKSWNLLLFVSWWEDTVRQGKLFPALNIWSVIWNVNMIEGITTARNKCTRREWPCFWFGNQLLFLEVLKLKKISNNTFIIINLGEHEVWKFSINIESNVNCHDC